MILQYEKDNKERLPLEYYLKQYSNANPTEIANRLGVPFDYETNEFMFATVFSPNGEFRSYRELPSGDLYYRQFQGRCIYRFNRKYGNRIELLKKVMQALDATPVSVGDVAYQLELFENLYIRFILWEGDEEFPFSSQILFSSNFTVAFGTYDLAEIGDICINMFSEVEKNCKGER